MTARLLSNPQMALWYTPPIMSLEMGVDITLLFIYCIKLSRKPDNVINREPFILNDAIKGMVLTYTLSFVFSRVPTSVYAVKETIKYYVENIGVLFILQRCLNTEQDVRLYFRTAVIIAFMISGLGILESIINDNPVQDLLYEITPHNEATRGRNHYIPPYLTSVGSLKHRYGMVRAVSFFGIHIGFGCACVFLLYLLYSVYSHGLVPSDRKRLLLATVLLIGGVIASNSKTPMIGLVILLFGFFRFRSRSMIFPVLFLIAVFLCFPSYLKNYVSLFDPEVAVEGRGSTIALRMSQMQVAMSLFRMSPIIGSGVGSIHYYSIETDLAEGILGAESSLMQILPERGILGLTVYLFIFICLYRRCKDYMPRRELKFYLLSVLTMEIATGTLDIAIWCGILIAVRRMFQLRQMKMHVTHDDLLCVLQEKYIKE